MSITAPRLSHASSDVRRRFAFLAKATLFLVALQCIFIAGITAAASLPRDILQQRAAEANSSPLITNIYSYDNELLGIPIAYDNNRFIPLIALQTWHGNPFDTAVKASVNDTQKDGAVISQDYYRYWHGWQAITTPLFFIGGMDAVSVGVGLLTAVAILCFIILLRRRIGTPLAATFSVVAFLSSNLALNFLGDLTLGISFSASVCLCALVLLIGMRARRGNMDSDWLVRQISLTVLTSGAIYCYLDFLTIPAAVLALTVFSALLAAENYIDDSIGRVMRLVFRFTLMYILGFMVTWLCKWLLAAYVMGSESVMSNILSEMTLWTRGGGHSALPQPDWPVVLQQLYLFSPQLFALIVPLGYMTLSSWLMAVAFLVTVVLACICAIKLCRNISGSTRAQAARTLMLGIPALFVPLYTLVMSTHAIVHIPVFSSRGWSIFFAICLISIIKALSAIGGTNVTEDNGEKQSVAINRL